MTSYRRAGYKGGFYFFTVVTYQRTGFLTHPAARECLRQAWQKVQRQRWFDVVALCLLPDHLHCIWKLPEGDSDYSLRWSLIKKGFTMAYLKAGGEQFPHGQLVAHPTVSTVSGCRELRQSASRQKKRERAVWQRRFWEHHIRDEKDLQRHVDYIHYNPVKHELVERPEQWPFSTYHKYVRTGYYGKQSFVDLQDEMCDIFVSE